MSGMDVVQPAAPTGRAAHTVGVVAQRSPVRRFAMAGLLRALDRGMRVVGPHYRAFFWVIDHTPPRVLDILGRWRAERAVDRAAREVPALARHYADDAVAEHAHIGRLRVPTMDKASYVQAYPLAERCVDGVLPSEQVTLDESSGSSGTPFNWVRTREERLATHIFVSHFARYCFGDGPFVTINAFSMGAWATGMNMAAALERNSLIKSTGPDAGKIFRTLEFLGPGHTFLICGYPPFLKHLIDEAHAGGFPLTQYRLMGLVGGEGMSEGLRDYLAPVFNPVYSGYGATDIEIGLAGESPISVAIRRLAREDERVRRALFGDDSRLPMVFQYNPLQHHVTVNERGELIFTISRLEVLAPRIAYNIHDEGGVARYDDVAGKLRKLGVQVEQLVPRDRPPVRLPFLWVYGRKDSTVSVMGANLYPEDVEHALYAHPDLAAVTNSFCLRLLEGPDGAARPCFAFELHEEPTQEHQSAFEQHITKSLFALNSDFREAMHEHPEAVTPVIQLYRLGEGPFAGDAGKIKQTRLVTA
jgi:phenylacetate-CoA ligase